MIGNTVTIKGAGKASITAIQAASGNFKGAKTTASLVVSKGSQTIAFTLPASNTFSKNRLIQLTGTNSAHLPITYKSANQKILTISGTNAVMKSRGTTTVTATQPGNANYNPAAPVVQTIQIN